jgi:hypothetical protein
MSSRNDPRLRVTRRAFLYGAGGATLALPWLERLGSIGHAQSKPSRPKRVIVMTYGMGIPLGAWRPTATGSTFDLPFVTEPLLPFKNRCLFVSSIDNRVLEVGGNAFVFGHPAKQEAALTGTLTTGAFPTDNSNLVSEIRADAETTGGANGPSVEQVIGQFLGSGQPLPSVNLAVDGSAAAAKYGAPMTTLTSNYFFEGRGNAISLNPRPRAAFDSLFASLQTTAPSDMDVARERQRARTKSVLDAVRASFQDLRKGLGRDDQRRLDEHAGRIRQLELDVKLSATCTAPDGIETVDDYSGYKMDQLAVLQNRILAHAMACDLAPIGRIEYANQQSPRFGIAELDSALDAAGSMYDWHAMVHGDPFPGTAATAFLRPGRGMTVTTYDQRLLSGYRFFVEQFANLLTELDAIPEGMGTTVLDNSLVVLASDLGEGIGHGHMKMGYVLAGNLGGARTGFHFDAGPSMPFAVGGDYFYAESSFNVSQLLNSMLDMAGVVDAQGTAATIGLGGYLEQNGKPRRIDGLF